jgi:hypothetical protein
MRTELDRCLQIKADRRKKVMYQVFWIAIDFTILFVIQLFVTVVYDISSLLQPVADWLQIIPSLLATIISILLIIPPLADVLRRVRGIGYYVVEGVLEGGKYQWDSGRLILKMFVNFATVIVGIIVFLMIIPLASVYEEVPILPVAAVVIGIIITYLIWDANKATYEKMCTVLTDGLIEPENKKED